MSATGHVMETSSRFGSWMMLVGEWMNVMTTYAVERDRKLFFATNDWGMPTCFFDASNPKELHKLLDNEGTNSSIFLEKRQCT